MELLTFVKWPSAPLTRELVLNSLNCPEIKPQTLESLPTENSENAKPLLQWCTYDEMDHERTLRNPSNVLSSAYTIRKALIRKHFLHRCILAYTTKHEQSVLHRSVPRTWDIDISFADELDDMWADDLWDLAEQLDSGGNWFILKPGMADRGMGIRIFNSKQALQQIFDDFDESAETDSDVEQENTDNTGVVTSQLRHFVIQEYVSNPVLVDPRMCKINGIDNLLATPGTNPQGHKFHLRAYCVAYGSLRVYLYEHVLALFSSEPYLQPSDMSTLDLRPHLTNTCIQENGGEENVRLLQELVGSTLLSSPLVGLVMTQEDVTDMLKQMTEILRETFIAALAMPVHFQPLPNAFELYGVDFLVCHDASTENGEGRFKLKLLEINSEPAIEMTGPRLKWVLEGLFVAICKTCVMPYFTNSTEFPSSVIECLNTQRLREC